MKKLCLLLVLMLGIGAWAGSVDTDGYYVMDGLELMAFDGATADAAAMLSVSSPYCTISGIADPANTNTWWLAFTGNNSLGLLPTDLTTNAPAGVEVKGWKLTFTNTSEAGGVNLVLVAGTAENGGWEQGDGYWADPGETMTAYLDITGPEAMQSYWIVASIPADYDVLTFEIPGAQNYLLPYDPDASDQSYNSVDPAKVDVTLRWKAAMDPNTLSGVNPAIVDQYVFMSTASDPNLFYVGATGVDPLDESASEYGPIVLPLGTSYQWRVVEALEGSAQTLTPGVSTIDDVDPNNLVGYKWSFNTLSASPIINTQPVSTRLGVNDASAVFSVSASSPTALTYQWFYSKDGQIDPKDEGGTDNPISSFGGTTDTLTIAAHNKAYQAYYYCRVGNLATVSGGGLDPDVYSDVVTLVVERKVAEYLFDGNLNDTSGSGVNGTGINSPGFAAGVDGGSALSLDGATQYVDFTDSVDPNNNNNAFPHADLVDDGGIGGGLDVGTVMCWVKLDTAPATVAPIMANRNEGWPTTWFQFGIAADGANTNIQTFIWSNASTNAVFYESWRPTWVDPFSIAGDGNWHMMAVTWDMSDIMKTYVDGNLIATSGTGNASTFGAWTDAGMRIGANLDSEYFDGLIDNLRVYNYEIDAEDIAQEYYDITGSRGCIYGGTFDGTNFNVDNTGSSYCKVDLADFAVFASKWLNDGFYPID